MVSQSPIPDGTPLRPLSPVLYLRVRETRDEDTRVTEVVKVLSGHFTQYPCSIIFVFDSPVLFVFVVTIFSRLSDTHFVTDARDVTTRNFPFSS